MLTFCQECFCCPSFQHTRLLVTSTVLGFLHLQLPHCEFLPIWASAVLGLCLTGPELTLLQPGYIRDMSPGISGECVISSVLSHRSKNLKWQTSVTALLQISFIWQAKENTFLRREGGPTQKRWVAQFWLLF